MNSEWFHQKAMHKTLPNLTVKLIQMFGVGLYLHAVFYIVFGGVAKFFWINFYEQVDLNCKIFFLGKKTLRSLKPTDRDLGRKSLSRLGKILSKFDRSLIRFNWLKKLNFYCVEFLPYKVIFPQKIISNFIRL